MSRAALSLFVFAIYLFVVGIACMLAPNVLLGLFDIPATNEVWIRVMGMLVVILGYYDMQAVRAEATDFFRWSIFARLPVIFIFSTWAALSYVKPTLILFGAVDLVTAIWTWRALAADAKSPKTQTAAR